MALPEEKTFLLQLGEALRRIRERAGLSREEAARELEEKDSDPSDYEIGEFLWRCRQRSGLTLQEVTRRMGKEPSAWQEIASWERNESSGSFYDVALYLDVVGATFDELVEHREARRGLVH